MPGSVASRFDFGARAFCVTCVVVEQQTKRYVNNILEQGIQEVFQDTLVGAWRRSVHAAEHWQSARHRR